MNEHSSLLSVKLSALSGKPPIQKGCFDTALYNQIAFIFLRLAIQYRCSVFVELLVDR